MNVRLKLDPKFFADCFEANFNPVIAAQLREQMAPLVALCEEADRRADAFIANLLKGQNK